jgi:hypothetical protein
MINEQGDLCKDNSSSLRSTDLSDDGSEVALNFYL